MTPDADRRRRAAHRFYAPLADAPSPARRVGWESDAAHRVRQAAILEALQPIDRLERLLDAGCGEAALLTPLLAAGFRGHYRGEDLFPAALDRARARWPDRDLALADAFAPGPAAQAVVCSGALNTRADADDHDAEVHDALRALWARTTEVLVLDVAVRDRHAPGALLAAADLPALWTVARELAAVVTVREDVVPGEALLVLRRDRRPSLERALGDDVHARAELHLSAGEPEAARATLQGRVDPLALLLRARADLSLGRPRDAERALRDLQRSPAVAARAALHLAGLLTATRRAAEAERLLEGLAEGAGAEADEARAALVEVSLRRGDEARAARWAEAIADPFVAREVLGRLEQRQ